MGCFAVVLALSCVAEGKSKGVKVKGQASAEEKYTSPCRLNDPSECDEIEKELLPDILGLRERGIDTIKAHLEKSSGAIERRKKDGVGGPELIEKLKRRTHLLQQLHDEEL